MSSLHPLQRFKNPATRWAFALLAVSWLAMAEAAPPVQVIVAAATEVTFVDEIEALGTLKANESVALTASVTETIRALHFDDGDRVDAGQILVEMASAEEQAQLKESRALEREAASQYRRVQSLATQGTAAQSLLDERNREWQTARARLIAIESRLEDRVLKAPFAGVMGLRNISVGALVEPGDLITTLDDDTWLKLDLTVPSVFLATLKKGIPVVAKTRAYGERVFRGEIHSVDSRVDPITRSVTARVLLSNEERLLKPGLLMQVTLQKNPRQGLAIPEAALMPQGREQFVLIAEPVDGGHKARRQAIRIGTRQPGKVEVIEGLQAGDLVISHGALRTRPGQSVAIKAIDDGSMTIEQLLSRAAPAADSSGDRP
jgi:membrane fusion protein (multidrug efflux system)